MVMCAAKEGFKLREKIEGKIEREGERERERGKGVDFRVRMVSEGLP